MDFRLQVFLAVANSLNFTKAAGELHISQPAVSKHIQELESFYKIQLFERERGKISLTVAGEVFKIQAEGIIEKYKALQLDMTLMSEKFSGNITIGASTSIAQYVLPPLLAKFLLSYPDVRLSVISGNTEHIENLLEQKRIDIGMIEGVHRKPSLKYHNFQKDELVLISSTKNKIGDSVTLDELCNLPLVLRENGSGTLEVIERMLQQHHKKLSDLTILLQLGNTESIKLFLEHNPNVYAIVSITAVTKELLNNTLKVVDIEGVELIRDFAFVLNQGDRNEYMEHFMHLSISFMG